MDVKGLSEDLGVSQDRLYNLIKRLQIDNQREITGDHTRYDLTDEQVDAIKGYYMIRESRTNDQAERIVQLEKELAELEEINERLVQDLDEHQQMINPYDYKAMAEMVQKQADFAYQCADSDLGADSDEFTKCENEGEMLDFIAALYRWFQYRSNSWREQVYCINRDGNVFRLRHIKTDAKIDLSQSGMTYEEAKNLADALSCSAYKDNMDLNLTLKEQKVLISILFNLLIGKQFEVTSTSENLLLDIFSRLVDANLSNAETETIKFGLETIRKNKGAFTHTNMGAKASEEVLAQDVANPFEKETDLQVPDDWENMPF